MFFKQIIMERKIQDRDTVGIIIPLYGLNNMASSYKTDMRLKHYAVVILISFNLRKHFNTSLIY